MDPATLAKELLGSVISTAEKKENEEFDLNNMEISICHFKKDNNHKWKKILRVLKI